MAGRCIVDLLRHGDTGMKGFCGSLDVPLNETGWQQLRRATQGDLHWQAVVSSPLRRCAEFAKVYADHHQLPLVLDARFRELDFGAWEGLDAAQLMEIDANGLSQFWTDPWSYTPSGGERLVDFEHRVRSAWEDSCAGYNGKRILLITHGGVIRMLLWLARKQSRSGLLSIDVPHASLHTLVSEGMNLTCR